MSDNIVFSIWIASDEDYHGKNGILFGQKPEFIDGGWKGTQFGWRA